MFGNTEVKGKFLDDVHHLKTLNIGRLDSQTLGCVNPFRKAKLWGSRSIIFISQGPCDCDLPGVEVPPPADL